VLENNKRESIMIATIVIIVFVALWIWLIWEFMNTPLMPDEYDSDYNWEHEKRLTEHKGDNDEVN